VQLSIELTAINSHSAMTYHPFIVDFSVNVVCFLILMPICNYFYYTKKLAVNFGSWVGFTILFGLFYLCARFFHVSWVIIPINGGIPWDKSGRLAFMFFVGVVCSIYTFIKNYLNGNPWQKLNPP
jgi:hypothetical protein